VGDSENDNGSANDTVIGAEVAASQTIQWRAEAGKFFDPGFAEFEGDDSKYNRISFTSCIPASAGKRLISRSAEGAKMILNFF